MLNKVDKEIKEIRQNLDFLKSSLQDPKQKDNKKLETLELDINKKLNKILDKLNTLESNIEKINRNLKPFLETQGFSYD